MIDEICAKAYEMGFIGIGFSRPVRPLFFEKFRIWVNSGRNSGMSWMEKNMEIREDPLKLLSGCRTLISLAYPYTDERPLTEDGFALARYSTPDEYDYHIRIKAKCRELSACIDELYGSSKSRIFVDSAPLLERSFAYSSGIGFIGKNNMLIIPGHGSYFYLSEILTTAQLDVPKVKICDDVCGTCLKCVEACPTGALKGPRDFDSSCCLSYLTVESKDAGARSMGMHMGKCFLGCDICQEACPHNSGKIERKCMVSTDRILKMTSQEFDLKFGKTALSRPGLERIKENIRAVRKNSL